jgi:integrase
MPIPFSAGKKPKVTDRRYLRPTEARRLIEAAGKRGRYPFRDRVLVRLVYRHGPRASEAVGLAVGSTGCIGHVVNEDWR